MASSTFGQLPPFDFNTDQWTIYSERLDMFFIAHGIKEVNGANAATENLAVTEQKRAILLTVLGTQTYTLLRTLIAPARPHEKTYAEITDILTKHFEPLPTEIVERCKFYKRDRKLGESVALYVAALRKKAEFCNFGATLDVMLRDRIVCGINNDHAQKQLLAVKNLDLQKAISTAQALETVEHDSKELKGQNQDTAINKIYHQSARNNSTNNFQDASQQQPNSRSNSTRKPCIRCSSTRHPEWECAYASYVCHGCGTKGHLEKACRKKGRSQYRNQWNHKSNQNTSQGRTNHIEDNEEINEDQSHHRVNALTSPPALPEYDIFLVEECHYTSQSDHARDNVSSRRHMSNSTNRRTNPPPAIQIECLINNVPVSFQVDTGSGYTIISESQLSMFHHKRPLRKGPENLLAYTGHPLNIKGEIAVEVTYKRKTLTLPLLIVGGQAKNIMGRDWIYSEFKILPLPEEYVQNIQPSPCTIDTLLNKYDSLFSPGMGCLKNVKVKLHIREDAPAPRFYKARSIPYHLKDKVEEEIRRLENEGIISPVPYAEFATPVVPIMKKDGTIRLCGDYKITTNKIIDTERYPLPKVDDIFAQLAGCTIFARIDMRNAYNQLELDEQSRNYVIISTTKGLYRYNRLPFGISSSSAIFQRHMEILLQDHPGSAPFQDDILIGGTSVQDLLTKLAKLFTTFTKAGLKLNRDKCLFLKTSVDFLGYRLDAEGLHPQEQKLTAIKEAPAPQNIDELRSFLGLINYYSRFIPDASTMLAPLYNLLNKSTTWTWSKKHQDTFEVAKAAIQSSDLLILFNPEKEVFLACDASPVGLGAVISHNIDGTERPIAFASRTLTSAEKNYAQIEREALSIIFGITRFRDYLLGKQFTLITDHKPLITIFSEEKPVPPTAAARLQRWALMLSAYNYKITHKKGTLHGNADALSRLPLKIPETEPPLPTEMARFGIIPKLVSDNATCFTSEEFKAFVSENGIEHLTSAPYHPPSNGQAERSVRTIKTTLKKITSGSNTEIESIRKGLDTYSEGSLDIRISRILLNHRRTPVNGGVSPAQGMLNRTILTRLDLFNPKLMPYTSKTSGEIRKASRRKVYARNFGKGDRWTPGYIVKQKGKMMYEIETNSGLLIRRHRNQIRFTEESIIPSSAETLDDKPDLTRNSSTPPQVSLHLRMHDTAKQSTSNPTQSLTPSQPHRLDEDTVTAQTQHDTDQLPRIITPR